VSRILVVGGSIAGLGAAMALARAGHAVTVLERDATPVPDSPVEAFEKWDRRGAPQVRHSHAFLARLRNLLRDRMPDVLEALHEAGAEDLPLASLLPPELDDREPRPGDEDLTMLGCRRLTFEWVLRRRVEEEPGVTLRDGVEVLGLLRDGRDRGGLPVVRGARVRDREGREEDLAADLVVDAGGRRSRLAGWLRAIGAPPAPEETQPCGIFYVSRFYRLRPGSAPPQRETAIGADMGYLKYGIFLGDGHIFSVTFAASPDDPPLRGLLRADPFAAAAAAIPATAAWVGPERAEPLTGVHGMASLRSTRRCLVAGETPVALGVVAIGDAAIHTNPLYGRGCTFALVHAWLLADALAAHPDDPHAVALALEAATRREIVPWYEMARRQDQDAIEVAAALREGRPAAGPAEGKGPVDPKAYMRDLVRRGLVPALRRDATVLRAFLRSLNLLDAPEDLMKRPDVLQRVLASYQQRHGREEPVLGPDREAMLGILGRAA
jgi:2-polyprenyl-6-methoxyphenol hydroxylase-like FAD-dependent oxidoreductase